KLGFLAALGDSARKTSRFLLLSVMLDTLSEAGPSQPITGRESPLGTLALMTVGARIALSMAALKPFVLASLESKASPRATRCVVELAWLSNRRALAAAALGLLVVG